MKVWVIMSNDFPDCVLATRAAAEEYVRSKSEADEKRVMGPRIYWRFYEFEVRE